MFNSTLSLARYWSRASLSATWIAPSGLTVKAETDPKEMDLPEGLFSELLSQFCFHAVAVVSLHSLPSNAGETAKRKMSKMITSKKI